MNDAVFVLPINLTLVMFTNPLGAYLLKRLNPKIILSMCTAFAVLTALSASITHTFWTFLLLYPTLFGFMMGTGYLPPLHCGWEWLPERKGLANGLILGAFGFGSFVFSYLCLLVVNPDNVHTEIYQDGRKFYPPEVAARVSQASYNVDRSRNSSELWL